jgi:hypothetical protein
MGICGQILSQYCRNQALIVQILTNPAGGDGPGEILIVSETKKDIDLQPAGHIFNKG